MISRQGITNLKIWFGQTQAIFLSLGMHALLVMVIGLGFSVWREHESRWRAGHIANNNKLNISHWIQLNPEQNTSVAANALAQDSPDKSEHSLNKLSQSEPAAPHRRAPSPEPSVLGQHIQSGGIDPTGLAQTEAPSQLALIRKKIHAQQIYPDAAREQNMSGVASVMFRIAESGVVTDLRIHQSSGYELLDSAALGSVKLAEPLPYVAQVVSVQLGFELDQE